MLFDPRLVRKQLAFMLGRQQVFLELEEGECEDSEDLTDIMSNVHLNNNFLALGREVREGGGGEGGREERKRERGWGGGGICATFVVSDLPSKFQIPPSSSNSSAPSFLSPPPLPSSTLQLDIMEPKLPEDIYKTHLEHAREQH